MTCWIKTIPLAEADNKLVEAIEEQRRVYPPEYRIPDPKSIAAGADRPSVVMAHSLMPEVLRQTFSAFASVLADDLPLSRRDHELIATAASATNNCSYCADSHADFLQQVTGDDKLAKAIRNNYQTADLTDKERIMIEYAVKLTRDSLSIQQTDIEKLRTAGFDDKEILQINLITAWFNYFNRVVNGLGVGRS
ncbi:MAG: peroxidase-related enzyme [Candidatus Obscuribacterales bacterium]|nr:peroxidase-related enzyme [Candidatus Obscuribacterales bacterium]